MNFFLAMSSPAGGQAGQGNPLGAMVPFILIIPIFYFILIRPQQKKQKQFQLMVASLKKNDKVVTTGGIHGLILNVKEHTLTIKIAENVKIDVDKSAVARVVESDADEEGEK